MQSERRRGGEKVKDMLIHARKEAVDTLCRGMCLFQHIYDYILQQHTLCTATLCRALHRDDLSKLRGCEGQTDILLLQISFLFTSSKLEMLLSNKCIDCITFPSIPCNVIEVFIISFK